LSNKSDNEVMLEHPGIQCCGEFWIVNPSQPSPTCWHSL